MAAVSKTAGEVNYPTSDGRPIGESDLHRKLLIRLIHRLEAHFAADPNVYVSGNLLVYYERGNIPKRVAPDVFVVRGVPKRMRDHFLVWEEGPGPQVVIELTSKSTRREDQNYKFKLYRDVLKVQEYFVFDPRQEYLTPPLQGYRLEAGDYQPILPVEGRLPSVELQLSLEAGGEDLTILNSVTKKSLDTEISPLTTEQFETAAATWRAIAAAARKDEQLTLERCDAAEKEGARLRALLEKLHYNSTAGGQLEG